MSLVPIILASYFLAVAPTDPIDQLAERLSTDHLWVNGSQPDITRLPPSASPEQVVTEYMKSVTVPTKKPQPWKYKILEIRNVKIVPVRQSYTAVLLGTNFGRKILLMQYLQGSTWNCMLFDVD